MNRRNLAIAALFAGIAMLGTSSTANADFRMRIQDITSGPTGVGAVLTDSPQDGTIVFNGAVGAFNVNVTTGLSQPPLGLNPAALAAIDLNTVNVSSTGTGTRTLKIWLEYDGPGIIAPAGTIFATGNGGGTLQAGAGSSVTFQSWINTANLVPGLGPDTNPPAALLATTGDPPAGSTGVTNLVFNTTPFSGGSTTSFTDTGSYSLFMEITMVFTAGAASASGDFHLFTSNVPEPATIIAALTGLPMLGGHLLRRRKTHLLAV